MRFRGRAAERGFHVGRRTRCSRRSPRTGRRSSCSPIRTIPPATCSRARRSTRSLRAAPGLVVVDEAYCAFAGGDHLMPRRAHPEPARAAHACRSSASPGLRLGLASGAPEWIAEIEKLRPPYNVNVLTLAAARAAARAPRRARSPGRGDRRGARAPRGRARAHAAACAVSRRRPTSCCRVAGRGAGLRGAEGAWYIDQKPRTARIRCSPSACGSRSEHPRRTRN